MYFLLYFQNMIIAGRDSPLSSFKKYFLVLLINAEEKKNIAIFDIHFYMYVNIYGIPDIIILEP